MTQRHDVKILLVDDLDENLIALEAILRRDGLETLKARSGPEALELLLVHDVALALLDVKMPDMDGFELAELMRGTERTRHVPIIFVTAGSHDSHRVFRGYDVGAVDFLFKPIDPVLLNHKVNTFVALHRERMERERLAHERGEMLRVTELFIAALSHDLRTPLSTMLMGMKLIEPRLPGESDRRTLSRMRSSGQRMSRMIEQMCDLSRARMGGGIPVDPKPMSARAMTERVVEELRITAPERTIVLELDDGSMSGTWDEGRLAQVLANLVSNALRYGTKAEPVRLRALGTGPNLVFEVHNGGVVADEIRSHLFEPFRRGANATREGLGLGLYIVEQLVSAHGGTITCTSSEAEGTTFRVELPREAPAPIA